MKNKNIVEEIKRFVEGECRKNLLGNEILINHFIPVVNYSKKLAGKKEVDLEIVEIAAWLHDIGSIIYGRENHHITGAEIAERKLRELNYPEEKIEKIKKCILNHRGSVNNFRESVEEQIIAEADCLDTFDRIEGLFEAAFVFEKKSRQESKESVKQKLQNKWNQLSSESRKLIKSKYDAAMLLLK